MLKGDELSNLNPSDETKPGSGGRDAKQGSITGQDIAADLAATITTTQARQDVEDNIVNEYEMIEAQIIVQQLERQLLQLYKSMQAVAAELKALEKEHERIKGLDFENADDLKRLQELTAQIELLQAKQKELQSQIEQLNKEISQLTGDLKKIEQQIQQTEQKIDAVMKKHFDKKLDDPHEAFKDELKSSDPTVREIAEVKVKFIEACRHDIREATKDITFESAKKDLMEKARQNPGMTVSTEAIHEHLEQQWHMVANKVFDQFTESQPTPGEQQRLMQMKDRVVEGITERSGEEKRELASLNRVRNSQLGEYENKLNQRELKIDKGRQLETNIDELLEKMKSSKAEVAKIEKLNQNPSLKF